MNGVYVRAVSVSVALCASATAAEHPTDTIRNKHLTMVLCRPDARAGYYRGSRFDWAGIIERVEFDGHRVFGRFSDSPDPRHHDRVMGPAEEFGMDVPVGYDETAVGDWFVKIGVGHLRKRKGKRYRFSVPHEIAGPAPWDVAATPTRVSYSQELSDPRGWAYAYTKRVVLDAAAPGFAIERELKNTGWRTLESVHYNHCFFIVDDDPIGPHYETEFLCDVKLGAGEKMTRAGAYLDGRTLKHRRPLKTMWSIIEGPSSPEHHGYTVRHAPSGIAMSVRGDRPLHQMRVWGNSRALCPEPFVKISVEPGDTFTWRTVFVFSKSD